VAYEAGPTGFGLYRHLRAAGIRCEVVAPSKLQKPAGDRVKTDAKDAVHLARLLRLDEITAVAIPTVEQESARDLVRAREDCRGDLMRARHRLGWVKRGCCLTGLFVDARSCLTTRCHPVHTPGFPPASRRVRGPGGDGHREGVQRKRGARSCGDRGQVLRLGGGGAAVLRGPRGGRHGRSAGEPGPGGGLLRHRRSPACPAGYHLAAAYLRIVQRLVRQLCVLRLHVLYVQACGLTDTRDCCPIR